MAFGPMEVLQALLLVQAALLAGLLLRRPALWPLAALLAVLALHMGWNLAEDYAWPLPEIRPGLSFLYGPLLLAMVRRLAWRDRPALRWPHLLPALLAPLLLAVWPVSAKVLHPLIVLATAAYLVAAFRELGRFDRILKATHAAYELQALTWLRRCLWGLTAVAGFDGARLVLPRLWGGGDAWLTGATYASALALVLYLVARGWQQPDRFAGLSPEDEAALAPEPAVNPAVDTGPGQPGQSDRPSQSEAPDWQPLAAELATHMQTARPFLDPELTVTQLADQLGWPAKQLSALLNQHHGRNFNDYINAARVETACAMLADPARRDDKLIAIQLDAGFASKSVFNAAFKRQTGLTPSQWRAQHARTPA